MNIGKVVEYREYVANSTDVELRELWNQLANERDDANSKIDIITGEIIRRWETGLQMKQST